MKEEKKNMILVFVVCLVLIPCVIYKTASISETGRYTSRASLKEPADPCGRFARTQLIKEGSQMVQDQETEDVNFPYISGYPDETFRPDQPVTREELAAMLSRLITKNQVPLEPNHYKDLYEDSFGTDAVNFITSLGVMKPVRKGVFEPEGTVTDDEFQEIIKKAAPYIKNSQVTLPSGNVPMTRVQAVTILNKLFNVKRQCFCEKSPFKDVAVTHEHYPDIICATCPENQGQ